MTTAQALEAAAVTDEHGVRWVRQSAALRAIGCSHSYLRHATEHGKLITQCIRVQRQAKATSGIIRVHRLDTLLEVAQRWKSGSKRHWTDEEDDMLCDMLGRFSMDFICRKLNRSEHAIQCRMKMLGTTPRTNSGWYTTHDAARALHCSPTTVKNWISRGIRCRTIPDRKRVRLICPQALYEWARQSPVWDGVPRESKKWIEARAYPRRFASRDE